MEAGIEIRSISMNREIPNIKKLVDFYLGKDGGDQPHYYCMEPLRMLQIFSRAYNSGKLSNAQMAKVDIAIRNIKAMQISLNDAR